MRLTISGIFDMLRYDSDYVNYCWFIMFAAFNSSVLWELQGLWEQY